MRTDWRLVFLLFVVGLFAAAQFAKIALSLEALKTLYPGSPVAFAVSAQSVVGILPGTVPGVPQSEGLIARHLAIYRAPRRIAPALSFLWHAMTFMGLLTFLPGFLGFWAGPVLPLMALLGTFGAGFLARRFPPQGIAFFGYLSSILAMAALVAVPDMLKPAVSIVLFILIGLVPGACFAAIPALNSTSDDRARANGVLAQMGNVGTFLSVPMFSATLWAGLGGPMVLAATLSLAGLIAIRVIHKKIAQSA